MLAGALCAVALLAPRAAGAQDSGATTSAAAGGHTTIVLPPVVVAGRPATLAVLGAQGRPVEGAQISLGGGVTLTSDATGRAAFTAPDAQGVLVAKTPDGASEASTTVVAAPNGEPVPLRVDSAPRAVLLRERFTIRGAGFRGAADENRVLLAGEPAAVLAASPAAIVALPNPRTPLGDTQLAVEAGGASASSGPVDVISLELTSGRSRGAPGETGEIHVVVHGTDRPVDFELRAVPAGRIELAKGNPTRGRTSGGATNTATITYTFRQPGEFALEARAVPQPLGLPDTDAARRELEEARRLAPADQVKHVEHIIELVEKHPQDVAQARDAVERLLAKKPEGQYGQHLEAAWRILLNRE